MKERYCSSCQSFKSPDNGQFVRNNSGRILRWRCCECRINALQNANEVKQLQKTLNKNFDVEL